MLPNNETQSAIRGFVAGIGATVPMTAVMILLRRLLPARERYELPPELIVEDAAHAAGVADELSEKHVKLATLLSHFGYGGAMGGIYGALAPRLPLPPVAGGIAFGLAVWGASYLGWLPAVRSRASAPREPTRRNAMMIAAHIAWGAATCVMYRALERQIRTRRQATVSSDQKAAIASSSAYSGSSDP
jgi:putative membrane protein